MARFDYIKFYLVLDQDRFQSYYAEFADTFITRMPDVSDRKVKTTVLSPAADGRRRYVIEAWGEAAEIAYWLDWSRWSPFLTRADSCDVLVDCCPTGPELLYEEIRKRNQQYNLSYFDSKHREKRRGISPGGHGWALGSHKSDMRISFYRRNSQPWRMEVQCSGSMLYNKVKLADSFRIRADVDSVATWTFLAEAIRVSGMVRLAQVLRKEVDPYAIIWEGKIQDFHYWDEDVSF